WNVDTLPILPFGQVSILLDSFKLECSGIDSSLCLRAVLENQEPDAERNNDSYCTEFEIATGIDHSGIVENHLIHPLFPDVYQSYQLLPNGDLRVFINSALGLDQEFSIPSYLDISSDALLQELVPIEIVDDFYWNGSPALHILALNDGSSIISSIFNGCDVVPPTGVLKLSPEGQKEWRVEFPDLLSPIVKMVFVDSNIILLDFFQGDDVLFDRDGNLIPIIAPDTSYHITVETNSGFIGSFQNRLDILTSGFDVIMSFPLPGFITGIHPLRDDAYLILAGNSYIILDKFNQLSSPPFEYFQGDLLWASENYFWQYRNEEQMLIKYGNSFTPIDTTIVPPGIMPRVGIHFSDTLVVVAFYNHPISEGVVIYRGHEEPFNLNLALDLGIINIEIPDTVLVKFIGSGSFEHGWIHYYAFIVVEIENFGTDTVHQYLIQNHERSFCFMCTNYSHVWAIDTLPIAPGETVTVSLGAFEPHCFQQEPGSICLTVHSPDHKADANYLNDDFCKPFSILINTSNVSDPFPITLKPNPTSDLVILEQEKGEPLSVFIINSTGMTLEKLNMVATSTEIPLDNYPSGLYYLRIENAKGQVVMKKVVVIK
ncbi:MAG: T9SS type A sorting domain-containing protein, partial [Saprospiraceae bacterium]